MDDIVKEFLIESYENLDRLDSALVALESNPKDKPSLDSIFRTMHTIKGSSGFLSFVKLQRLAHVGENLLSRLREGKLTFNSQIASALLASVDGVRQILARVEQTAEEGANEYPELIELLTRLADGSNATAAPSAPVTAATVPAQPVPVSAQPVAVALSAEPAAETAPVPTPAPAPKKAAPAPATDSAAVPTPLQNPTKTPATPSSTPPAPSSEPAAPVAAESSETRSQGLSDSNIRVDVGLLNKLMNLVGELVLARNQIVQHSTTSQDPTSLAASQRLNLITTELQESVMKTRMQPIGNVWSKFPRVVRDISAELGKKIRLEMEGKETELDRTIIEAIKDPLTHIMRNSIDHGIESPTKRAAKGKPEEGVLRMRAFHEGGQVNIEITDDGAGVNTAKVKEKAVEKGMISAEQAARMSEREALDLIFLPSVSTAEKVTNVSGRGVGMDVVRTNIEKIGGSVDVLSELGRGTTLKIKIPLTLAIIPALTVTCGGDRYAIPQVSLLELVRLEGEQARQGVELVFGAPVYRLRGNLLPLVYLNRELKLDAPEGAAPAATAQIINIVVLQADSHQFGLVVDQINDTQEIVVKPLGKHLNGIPVFAGVTIMGDGTVALILDVLGIAQSAHVVSQVSERNAVNKLPAGSESRDERRSLLICKAGERERMAIPLSLVGRLEKFSRSAIEKSGQDDVVQYRGQIMPLLRLDNLLGYGVADESQELFSVVVYSENGHSVGLVVGEIVDIVEDTVQLQETGGRPGIAGSAVIRGRVTELIDVPAVVRGAIPSFGAALAA